MENLLTPHAGGALLRRVAIACVCALALPGVVHDAAAARLELVVGGLAQPVFVTHAGDGTGRLYVVEQAGVVKVLSPDGGAPTVFLDITDGVLDGGERGLLGLAFHPGYAANGRFFVNYTRDPDGATVIAEYRRSPDPAVALPTGIPLLVVPQPFSNHNGGMIAFGHDGLLYVGMGDGGGGNDPANRAQNIDDLLGKILRIDVDGAAPYGIPPDNPFAGSTPGRDEIFALGLRNPFRFSFDRSNGQLFVGDVGQGLLEEIDVVTLGANLGWRVFEGTHCTGLDPLCLEGGFTAPVTEYAHAGGRCSVTGGYVYRGSRRTLATGTYVFGDFCTGEIFTLLGGRQSLLLDSTLNISSFGEDERGEVYVVGLGGTVHRLVPDGGGRRFDAVLTSLPEFDGQGTADIFWRHSSPGTTAIWLMSDGALASASVFRAAPEWYVVAFGDVNGDTRSDLLWRSAATGAMAIWIMDGGAMVESRVLGVGPGWDLVATGDVNGDGRADILWRSASTGAVATWLMNGTQVAGTLVASAGLDWQMAGVGDVNGDGTADILWRDGAAQSLAIWLMHDGVVQTTAVFGVDAGWRVAALSDLNGDGRADIVWRQEQTGVLALWFMNGAAVQGASVFGVDPAWDVLAAGDVSGDGKADLLWRHPQSGLLSFWIMDGGTLTGASAFGVGNGWAPLGSR